MLKNSEQTGLKNKLLNEARDPIGFIRKIALLGIILAMIVVQFLVSPNIVSSPASFYDYIMKLLMSITSVGLISAAVTMLMISGCIDLSVGSTMTLAAIMSCSISSSGIYAANPVGTILLAFIAPLAIGLICGAINGFFVGVVRLNAFMTTMATMYVFQAFSLLYNGGRYVSGRSGDSLYVFLGRGNIINIPVPIIVLIIIFILFAILLHRSVFGRRVYAVGGNPTAAQFSGIGFPRLIISVYMLTGLMAGFAGLYVASWTISADMAVGTGREFDAITAVVLGGVTLTGGVGTISGTALGVLFMGTLKFLYIQLEIPPMTQWIVQGVILIAVVYLNGFLERMKERRKGE